MHGITSLSITKFKTVSLYKTSALSLFSKKMIFYIKMLHILFRKSSMDVIIISGKW